MIPDLILQTLFRVATATPSGLRRALARRSSRIEYHASALRRSAVLENLGVIAGTGHPSVRGMSDRERTARAMFESYHRFLLEFCSHQSPDAAFLDRQVRFSGMERLYAALAPGRGAVVCVPHLGNWEIAGLVLARLGHRVHVVTGVQFHARLTRAVRRLKEQASIRVSTTEDGFTPLLTTLRRGGLVVLLADGDRFARSISAPFFGRAVPFPSGPAILARRARAPLLLGHTIREGGERHLLSVEGIVEPDPRLPLHADLSRLTASVARSLERSIASHLDQWCVFRPVFRDAEAA